MSSRMPKAILARKSSIRKRKTSVPVPTAPKPSVPSNHTIGYSDHRTTVSYARVLNSPCAFPEALRAAAKSWVTIR